MLMPNGWADKDPWTTDFKKPVTKRRYLSEQAGNDEHHLA